jgi:hypothetical protein
MKHFFRLNAFQKGYILFAGEPFKYRQFPLDIQSEDISKNYLSTQKRIDSFISRKIPRWYFSISNLYENELPVISYGCFLSTNDEKNRKGITFIHAIEIDKNSRMDEYVLHIITLLSYQNIDYVSKLLADLAIGSCNVDQVLNFFTDHFDKSSSTSINLLKNRNLPIKEIKYDCGGSSGLAWLAITASYLNTPSPWEIYEEYSEFNPISILSSFTGDADKFLLSEYLHKIICDYELMNSLPESVSVLEIDNIKNDELELNSDSDIKIISLVNLPKKRYHNKKPRKRLKRHLKALPNKNLNKIKLKPMKSNLARDSRHPLRNKKWSPLQHFRILLHWLLRKINTKHPRI